MTLLLVVCTISYGSSWAFEGHVDAADYDDIGMHVDGRLDSQMDNQGTDQNSTDNQSCDHCCHAFAHMLALCTQHDFLLQSNRSNESCKFSQDFISYISSPASRPPKV